MFAKLFQSMYDGSLATKGPWEALITFQQMLVLADKFGDVDMTAEVISRRTIIPLEIIEKGLKELLKPDPESRDPTHEGRRIVPINPERNWGWHIVNYTRYSSIRSAEERREYKAAYYRDKRSRETMAAQPARALAARPKAIGNGAPWFDEFWAAYPRKVAKATAYLAWLKISPDFELRSRIFSALRAQAGGEQWRREAGKFIPHAASWLNARRWEDEAAPPVKRPFPI